VGHIPLLYPTQREVAPRLYPKSLTRSGRGILGSGAPFPIPYSLFPIPYSLFPIPYSLFPIPYSLFPIPYSLFPIPYSLFPIPYSLFPMFQATRRRLALWYTAVTAVLLLLFASGFYFYVRTTLVERVDDTLNHVVEIVERSLVIEPNAGGERLFATVDGDGPPLQVNVEASFRDNARAVEDDHIDLEWFGPGGQLLWSTLTEVLPVPLHVNPAGETVRVTQETVFRQITERVQANGQVLGYLRVSHPWFEVTKPSRG
jgi:hypothetical protein